MKDPLCVSRIYRARTKSFVTETQTNQNSSSSSYGGFEGQQVAVAFCLTAINIIDVIV